MTYSRPTASNLKSAQVIVTSNNYELTFVLSKCLKCRPWIFSQACSRPRQSMYANRAILWLNDKS